MNRFLVVLICLLAGCSKGEGFDHEYNKANLPEFNAICREFGQMDEFRADAELCAQKYAGAEGGITFTGSSTISWWPAIEADFPDLDVRNMGIGGLRQDHIMAYSEMLIFERTPDVTVLYVGDNDPYAYDFATFKRRMDAFLANYLHRLPESTLILLSIKPSPARTEHHPFYLSVNDLYKSYATVFDRVHYVDIWSAMKEGDTPGFFIGDGVHLNEKGYDYVVSQLTPVLEAVAR